MPYFGENAAEVTCAWNANSSVAGSTGVSSGSDTGTGNSRVNFSSSFSNTGYAAVMGGAASNTGGAWDSFINCNRKNTNNISVMIAFPSGQTNGGSGGANTNLACFPN